MPLLSMARGAVAAKAVDVYARLRAGLITGRAVLIPE
jgi:hypothetical protein